MARYVTVSSIGTFPMEVNEDTHPKDIISKMKIYLRKELNHVLPDKPDIIVLPEACDRPYHKFPLDKRIKYYLERGNQILDFLKEIAYENNTYITYPAARQLEDGTWRNSIQLIDRSGKVCGVYDKNHTVIGETTEAGILPGKDPTVVECDFGRVGFAICFDLNFEELRRKYEQLRPDILVFSSMYHGGLMANYWAYSCRMRIVGAIAALQSYVISPLGQMVASNSNYYDFLTHTINLDCRVAYLDDNFERFENAKKKYERKIKIIDPGYIGAVLISSETDEFTIDDVIDEFGIELIDQYFERSLQFKQKYV